MTIRLLCLAVLASACTSTVAPGPAPVAPPEGADLIRSQKERLGIDSATSDEIRALAASNAEFAFDLYRGVSDQGGNVFVAPHSISVGLAMAYAGAEGNTEREIADALHFDLPDAELHRTMNALDRTLALRDRPSEGVTLRNVNAIWPDQQYSFLPTYLDAIGENYGAGLYLLDYRRDSEGARGVVNGWVFDATEGHIPEVLPPNTVNGDTRLVLTNAVYFDGSWKYPFDPAKTADGSFATLDGREVSIPLMTQSLHTGYAETEAYQAIELPYLGDDLAFVAVLPRGDFASFEAGLDASSFAEIRGALAEQAVDVALPRFSMGQHVDLHPELRALGVEDAFVPGTADLSGMDGSRMLYVQAVHHEATLDVSEIGTVASGATAVVIGIRSGRPAIRLDRPFLVSIVDRTTGAILFLGRVADPSAT
jgi:serpin B